jgi:hypothetical protein
LKTAISDSNDAIRTLEECRKTVASQTEDLGKAAVSVLQTVSNLTFTLNGRINNVALGLPVLLGYYSDLTGLMDSVSDSIGTLSRMKVMYGDLSPVVRKPFSGWRLPSHSIEPPADDSIRDGERWARSLEDYVAYAQNIRHRWHGDFFMNDLFRCR